jgi:predicted ribosome quality control (RQC) complex YloA/Tae2 family protein
MLLTDEQKSQLCRYAAICRKRIRILLAKIEKQQVELCEARNYIHYQQLGDTILAHPAEMRKGMTECIVENIHTHDVESMALNPRLTPIENAELYYKKARKGKRSLEIAEEKVVDTTAELNMLERLLASCTALKENTDDDAALWESRVEALRAELADAGLIKLEQIQTIKPKKAEAQVPYRHYIFGEWHVYIGKNDAQNDELSIRFAKPSDIWMHVGAHAGSHVVIKRPKNTPWPPQDILNKAASMAVWFSKAKHTSFAEVHVTEARYVHKRRKSPPGQVMLDNYKTIRCAPVSPQIYFPGDYERD